MIVPPVEQLDLDARIQLPQPADLAVLAGHQSLPHCRQLDVEPLIRQVKVRREHLCRPAIRRPSQGEAGRLVGPPDPVIGKDAGEVLLERVRERLAIAWQTYRLTQQRQCRLVHRHQLAPGTFLRFAGSPRNEGVPFGGINRTPCHAPPALARNAKPSRLRRRLGVTTGRSSSRHARGDDIILAHAPTGNNGREVTARA